VSIEGAVKPGQLLLVAYVYGIPEKTASGKNIMKLAKKA
jgi:hypothetical protein